MELETAGDVHHCGGEGHWDLRDVALRVWLRADQLMGVVDRPARIEAADGTWVQAAAGVPVMSAPAGASHRSVS